LFQRRRTCGVKAWCLELHSVTTLPLLFTADAGAASSVQCLRVVEATTKFSQKTYRPNKHDLEVFKIVLTSAINATKR
jgi:hypothetical protein